MRRTNDPSSDSFARLGAATAGVVLLASAALAARLAWQHMAFLGEICGTSLTAPHCGWCAAAAALTAAGLTSLGWAAWPARKTLRIRSE
ncbi:hypothetical protein [Phenylobacterium sp.]|uniref:hypothetical protein n=1 Tax=Phenylobacterium sp. TaxID=1871053 RepID=UPI0035AEB2C9